MRWFQRDDKFYYGPVSDQEIDMIHQDQKIGHMAGIACTAGSGRVDTYVTLPITDITIGVARNIVDPRTEIVSV